MIETTTTPKTVGGFADYVQSRSGRALLIAGGAGALGALIVASHRVLGAIVGAGAVLLAGYLLTQPDPSTSTTVQPPADVGTTGIGTASWSDETDDSTAAPSSTIVAFPTTVTAPVDVTPTRFAFTPITSVKGRACS